MDKLKIKQATKQGYTYVFEGGVFDNSYPDSKTRRGRVQGEGGSLCPTLTCESDMLYRFEKKGIRKLTPREYWRLMDFDDEDFDKAAAVNSKTQLYKQAGNSIVVSVLEAIFRKKKKKKLSTKEQIINALKL